MQKKLWVALVAAAFLLAPLAMVPTAAQAKTEKQLNDERKGKAAKEKSAAKSAQKRAAKKAPKKPAKG